MSLAPGTLLGPYEIVASIGKGGMGEVYRARDPRMGRDVAIKVSAEQFTERFDREVRAIGALNHPNICHLYDVGPNYLVMEFVEGASPKGPLPLEEAMKIARQISDALEAAHEKGIVHRDLKPANIKITPEGTVKVLDFGLAKVTPAEAGATTENSPTLSMAATQAGMILGTAAYMAPEQARGKPVDKRADIWAFGVVMFELLTGEQLFDGEDIVGTLAAVVHKEPDFNKIPVELRRLLKKCLQKDPKNRLRDMADGWELVGQASGLPGSQVGDLRHGLNKWIWPSVAAAVTLALGVLAFVHFREAPPVQNTLRYTVATPEKTFVLSFAVSPDGRYVVIAAGLGGNSQLWLRALNALQAQPIPFTDGASYPFWSPDSRNIGFFAQGKLKRIPVSGGPSQSLCDAAPGLGGSWSREGVIVFSPGRGAPIQKVSAGGGTPADVSKSKGDLRHPTFLPDGRHFLYTTANPTDKVGIYVSSLDGGENRRIVADLSSVVFMPASSGGRLGHILFVRDNTLMAQPFDAVSAQPAGDVFPVLGGDGVSLALNTYAPVSASENGVMLFLSGGGLGPRQMTWFDRSGKPMSALGAPGNVVAPSISPDQKVVAYSRNRRGAISDVLLLDQASGREIRFTSDDSQNLGPAWSPKQDRIAFSSDRGGLFRVYQKAANSSSQEQLLLPSSSKPAYVMQWSLDGRFIVYTEMDPKTKEDIWVLPVEEGAPAERKPIQFVHSEFAERHGQLSPDSHWMAYTSDESGHLEVYVRPFPSGEGVFPISRAGGEQPRWRGNDGKELFYVAPDGTLMAVTVKAVAGPKPSFEAGAPTPLFDSHMVTTQQLLQYDVSPDGKRFLVDTVNSAASSQPMTVVVNPQAEWKK